MYNWWIARSARELGRRLVCGFLLLLLEPCGPGRHDAVHARVGDGLPEMLAKVPGDGDEGTAHGGLTVEHLLRLVGGGVIEGDDGVAKMRERIVPSLKDFRFVARERADGPGIEAGWRGGTQCPCNAIIRGDDVRKHFVYGANAFGRTPGVFLEQGMASARRV
jgi:hypothetical protein